MALTRTTRRRGGWRLWIIPVLFVLMAGLLIWSQREKLLEKIGLQPIDDTSEQTFVVGEEVTLSGTLSSSTNLRQYAMMLTTADDGIVGVKSNSLDLSPYRNKDVILRGSIIDIINNVPVVDAVSVVSAGADATDTTTVSNVQYISNAGLLIDPSDLNNYTASIDGSDTITFSSDDGDDIVMTYFGCTDDESAQTGCDYIINQLASAESRFTGKGGDVWVQLPETNTWFGTNDNRIGYKISNIEKNTIIDLMDSLTFVNDRHVDRSYMNDAKSACATIDHTLDYVASTSIDYRADAIRLTLKGTDTESHDMTCVVSIDPRSGDVDLISTDADENDKEESTDDTDDEKQDSENTTNNTDTDNTTSTPAGPNTDPAPAMGSELPFTSSKGYTIVFPSSNVAFQGVNNTQSIGIDGVAGCWSQMNVVAFSNAANVVESPAVIMYDCRDVDETIGSLNGYIRKDGTESDKTFFIKVVNPAWTEFANAITIK